MAYARLSDRCDVFVIATEAGVECLSCALVTGRTFRTATAAQMLDHLVTHRAAGHQVPEDTLTRLREDGS